MSSQNKLAPVKEYLSSRNGKILLFLILICVLVLIGALPKAIREHHAKTFSKPLFKHELPENSRALQSYAEQSEEDGSTFATLILQSTLSEEELLAFYSDISYPPAQKGDTVTLQVLPVPNDHLTILKNAGLYSEDQGQVYYIYLYSKPAE